MKKINEVIKKKNGKFPEKILQFGEGNFLRGFTDWMIDKANSEDMYEGSIVAIQPRAGGHIERLKVQDNMYTVVMRGLKDGQEVEEYETISSISRSIDPYKNFEDYIDLSKSEDLEVFISNTTEAGIIYEEGMKLQDRPQKSFPAKVCAFLYQRYKYFKGNKDKGLLFLPVELIDNNGDELKKIVIKHAMDWDLSEEFIKWVEESNVFANTLVDRIVPGFPKDEIEEYQEKLGYKDNILVTTEIFNLWVIEADKKYSEIFPLDKTEANVIWTDDAKPYKKRKVRILNGAHTSSVLAAYLSGHNFVLDMMNDKKFKNYLSNIIYKEVIPGIDLSKKELTSFAEDVFDRFRNPFIKHKLLDISLNSVSKFKARCLPSIIDYKKENDEIPQNLGFAFAALIKFYDVKKKDNKYFGIREDGKEYEVRDEKDILEFMENAWREKDDLIRIILSNTKLWSGEDLTKVEGLEEKVQYNLNNILKYGIKEAMNKIK